MVRVIEYRIPMPVSVEEYQLAQLYTVSHASKEQTGGGEGIEVLQNYPFHDQLVFTDGNGREFRSGQYTHKLYKFESRIPRVFKMCLPKSALCVEEKAWNCYPYCRTVYSNEFLGKRFNITVESIHIADHGESHNSHNLAKDLLKKREVIHIDIANDQVSLTSEDDRYNPSKLKSQKSDRGALTDDWIRKKMARMCAYKLVTIEFKIWGTQRRAEGIIDSYQRDILTMFHRQLYCLIDEWIGLTMKDIRKIEEETKAELGVLVQDKQKRGITLNECDQEQENVK